VSFAPGLVIAERFRLDRVLGQGGMGSVWLAWHLGLDVPCAVKFIHAEAARSPELRARFEREAKAAAQIRSPHVVQILDHGVWRDAPYIAMEYLEGEDLAHRLKRLHRLSPRETHAIAAQVGRALVKAHAAGLVHRDLKPANIFLVRDDDREIAKVLDFGIAKTVAVGTDGATQTGAVLGTPSYMSPEQARGNKSVDHRSDLWALGVVVYQCLTGVLPFRSDALGDLLVKIIVDPIPVPSAVAPVPPGFDLWWSRAAGRDPDQRYQGAREMVEALGLALGVGGWEVSGIGIAAPEGSAVPPPAAPRASLPSAPAAPPPAPGAEPSPTAAGTLVIAAPIVVFGDTAAPTVQRLPEEPPAPSHTTTPLGQVVPVPAPPAPAPPAPAPLAPPGRSTTPIVLAGAGCVALAAALGLFLILRPDAASIGPAAPALSAPGPSVAVATSTTPEPPAASPVPPPGAPSASATAPAPSARAPAAAATSSSAPAAAPLPAAPRPPAPAAPGKRRTDFGF
jgi:serine/threonine-protein kinase